MEQPAGITTEIVLAQVTNEFCRTKCEKMAKCAARFVELANKRGYDDRRAVTEFNPHVDIKCQGYKKPESTVCGAPEEDCGHKEGPDYLPDRALEFYVAMTDEITT